MTVPLANLGNLEAELAQRLDAAICGLVRKGAELGELERDAAIGADGDWREIRRPPAAWFERLDRALEVGAFDRLAVDEIVDRILAPRPE